MSITAIFDHNQTDLWAPARQMLSLMAIALGGPVAIAALTWLGRNVRRDILDWLVPLEAYVRKALLCEAALMPRAGARAKRPVAQLTARYLANLVRRKARATPRIGDMRLAHTWFAPFRCKIPRDHRYNPARDDFGPRIRDLGPPILVSEIMADASARYAQTRREEARVQRQRDQARRLALRYEAVRRVIAHPLIYAQKLARGLRRRADCAAAARRCASAGLPRNHADFCADAFRAATKLAHDREHYFESG